MKNKATVFYQANDHCSTVLPVAIASGGGVLGTRGPVDDALRSLAEVWVASGSGGEARSRPEKAPEVCRLSGGRPNENGDEGSI